MRTWRKIAAITALALLGACASRTIALEPRWAPLARVAEDRTGIVSPPRHAVTTIESTAYVRDLDVFEQDFPAGSIDREALLLHERLHSVRELAAGPVWYVQYALPGFRWREEQLGWGLEIAYHVQHGDDVDVAAVARILTEDYVVAGAPMVGYEDALAWVTSSVAEARQ